jgi:hypothetical protein
MEHQSGPNRRPIFKYLSFVLDPLSASPSNRAMFSSTFVSLGTPWTCVLSNLLITSQTNNSPRVLTTCLSGAKHKFNSGATFQIHWRQSHGLFRTSLLSNLIQYFQPCSLVVSNSIMFVEVCPSWETTNKLSSTPRSLVDLLINILNYSDTNDLALYQQNIQILCTRTM